MPKFYLYARKSTDEEDKQVLSIQSQLDELRQYASRENLYVVDEFIEMRTAKEPGRPVFNALMDQVEKGFADGLLAWHPDRLARNSVDGGKIIYLCDTGKITDLRFPTYRFDNTAQGKFMLSIMFGQSKYYVDNLAENVRRGIRTKLNRGEWPGWAPWGYMNDYRYHRVVLDPEKAPGVRRLFETYATGNYSLEELWFEVRKWGLISRTGKPIGKSSIYHALKNPFYYGMMRLNGELYEGSHPPLISKQVFDRCKEVMKQRSKPMKRGKIKWLYIGFMKCGECGASITAERKKGHTYYRCSKKIVRCSQAYVREEALLEQVRQAILEIFIDDEIKDKMFGRMQEIADQDNKASSPLSLEVEAKLKEFDEKIERLTDLYIAKEITREEYQKKKSAILHDKMALKGALDKARTAISGGWLEPAKRFLTTCNQASSVAWQGNSAVQKDFLRIFGSNFILKDRNLLFEKTYPYKFIKKASLRSTWLPNSGSPQTITVILPNPIHACKKKNL